MDPIVLRNQIVYEEFDYQMLLDGLQDYDHPRDKITDLLRKGIIVRVKKGLYVFGDQYRRRPVSREVLANMIYGPSFLSLEYALQYHGLIPEAVERVTSVTTGRTRTFTTPLGMFTYRQVSLKAFRIGMDSVLLEDGRGFLIATPEKALADKVVAERDPGLRSWRSLQDYLLGDLRVDVEELRRLDADRLEEIANRIGSRKIRLLSRIVAELARGPGGRG